MKVLILGSGGLKIGQAGEFDYSGSQGIKALKEEGHYTILLNPNIATVQTDPGTADKIYLLPLTVESAKAIIESEKPDALLISVGGQTALNLGMKLYDEGHLKGIKVLGTDIETIRATEDRKLFCQKLDEINIPTPKSISCVTADEAVIAAEEIGYPLMMRSGFSLGGLGSGKIKNKEELYSRASQILKNVPQILIEEYLEGYKELEYEIIRDAYGQKLVICNMENLDPMGVHTGESIVVAPSQTLTNFEYHHLREMSLKIVEHLKIVGECNIQYALNPHNGEYRVIELNARLSRSSALASKATGYPLAYISTKLQLGKKLHELKNQVTLKTTAFFEPALDYIVVKIPRWDTQKLKSERTIGSEMKSVGEVMAIGRTFQEALQKAVRMLNIGATSLTDYPTLIENPENELYPATDRRLFALSQYFKNGGTIEKAHSITKIDHWFLNPIYELATLDLIKTPLKKLKQMGFSDKAIAKARHQSEESIRDERKRDGFVPKIKQIDTLAGEFDAATNYLYTTYNATDNDVQPLNTGIIILGSGPYAIGSSVEFDWCAVNLSRFLRKKGQKTLMINSNPETVSTDFDESDRLYFEELTIERVRDLYEFENPTGVVVSVGGQIANNLALPLAKQGVKLLGTTAESIDKAENRKKFSELLEQLAIDQPEWTEVTTLSKAQEFGLKATYPLLVRPSYVLSGAAMKVISTPQELEQYLTDFSSITSEHPVVISKFIENAKELEIDGLAFKGEILFEAISEHIENAGIHSGDATIVLPPQKLYLETIRQAKQIAKKLTKALNLSGPFNLQLIASDNHLKVIEMNVRASRSFPFVAKVTKYPLASTLADILLGDAKFVPYESLDLDYVGVKTPQFSYHRLKGANPVAHVEMASTGEVAALGSDLFEAFLNSYLSADQEIKGNRLLVSVGGDKKDKLLPYIKQLYLQGWELFATENTHTALSNEGIHSTFLYKASDQKNPSVLTAIHEHEVDLIINIPAKYSTQTSTSDGFKIRRLAIDCHIPLITNLQVATILLQALALKKSSKAIKSLMEYVPCI